MPFLTKKHKRDRKVWGMELKKYTDEDWETTIWSDECYVLVGDQKGTIYVTRTADEKYDEDCVIPRFTQSDLRVMVWGCIMKNDKGPLVVLEYPGGKGGGMTAQRYQDQVLDGVFYDYWLQKMEERGQVKFQQDGARSHTAKVTKAWLARNQVETFPHPAASPDLSPIEPLWHTLKKKICARECMPTSLDKLIEAVREAWDEITLEEINVHIESMHQRTLDVVAAKGSHTKY